MRRVIVPSTHGGACQGLVGTGVDVTEQEHILDELKRSEHYSAQGQPLSHAGSWSFKPDLTCEYWSRELYEILGFDPRNGIPTISDYLTRVHPEDRKVVEATIRRMIEAGEGCNFKKRIIRPDGVQRVIRCVGIPIRENGVVTRFVRTLMDITEQEELNQELRRREAYLAEAQRLSHTGSFGWNVVTGERTWSEETYRILGYDRSIKPTYELVRDRIHPDDLQMWEEALARASEGKHVDLEYRLLMPDGSVKHLHAVAYGVQKDGKFVETVGTAMDITERKRAEENLRTSVAKYRPLVDTTETLNRDEVYRPLDSHFADSAERNTAASGQKWQTSRLDAPRSTIRLDEPLRPEEQSEGIIGCSAALRDVLGQLKIVAPTNSTVLLLGETGTGKELMARALHNRSSRGDRPFVRVNCAAIPSGLLESELFGHERGAFTGAIARKIGRFEMANGGTLFLDEIGDIPPELQPKLLRVLQEQEFERLGNTQTIRVNVRVVAATSRNLPQMVAEREFRIDLYYRLNVFPIRLPALRERSEDIPLLVRHFVQMCARSMQKSINRVSSESMKTLMGYPWPGNVRELQNFIERAVILSPGKLLKLPLSELEGTASLPDIEGQSDTPATLTLRAAEREQILQALAATNLVVGGEKGAAARLGLKRTTLLYKMRKHGISRDLAWSRGVVDSIEHPSRAS